MNFLLRSSSSVSQEAPSPPTPAPAPEVAAESQDASKTATTSEGSLVEDPIPQYPSDDPNGEFGGGRNGKGSSEILETHTDVFEEEGWIIIPNKVLPADWNTAPDMHSLRSMDRSFVLPGEQVHILACLSAHKQETEIITPFKVAEFMRKSHMGRGVEKQSGFVEKQNGEDQLSSNGKVVEKNGENMGQGNEPQQNASGSESFFRLEDQQRKSEALLKRFKNSHFLVRIAEASEPLWSVKSTSETTPEYSDSHEYATNETEGTMKSIHHNNAYTDRGRFDANVLGGIARDTVKCCYLSNGDMVVALKVNVAVDCLRDPIIEVLQFEKCQDSNNTASDKEKNHDPCGELLKWLFPLDNTLPSASHSISPPPPPPPNSGSEIGRTSHKPASSGSQLFSFSNLRSYSMSSHTQNAVPPPGPSKAQSAKHSYDHEEWLNYSSEKALKRTGVEGLLSFRGVSLERGRYSIRCGSEGIHTPGRRWRRKLEIVQPVAIHSYAADCNTDDFLCVQIKNVSPVYLPDVVVYVDSITVICEEASKGGPPASLPIACIEAGNEHILPNLALRRGEEHSFILKPALSSSKVFRSILERSSKSSSLSVNSKASDLSRSASGVNKYMIMVSCHCNYTESRLFFKHPTDWRPRIPRDLMISITSETPGQCCGPDERVSQLPVQVLTLQASNMTSEDLTMTVLAPAYFSPPPSVISLNSSPASPNSSFIGFSEFSGRSSSEKNDNAVDRLGSGLATSGNREQLKGAGSPISFSKLSPLMSDVLPAAGSHCNHLWLQSRVPLGCVPSHSTATIKLELLPLTDGIITLDTLQIDVKERDVKYIPEHSLKINATSSISSGII